MANASPEPAGSRTVIQTFIAAVLTALSFVVCLAVLYIAATFMLSGQGQWAAEPTLFVFPTSTPTLAGPTPNPTWTPTPRPTSTPLPTATVSFGATNTPRPTGTFQPTETPEPTSTPEPTETPTGAATATTNPVTYVLRNNQVVFTENYTNSLGCDWAGIAGTVYNRQGEHKTGVIVHVTGNGLDERRSSGSKTEYGASGWEVYLGNRPLVATFTVQLETDTGAPLSAAITFQTRDTCDANLALLVFDRAP